MITYLVNFTLCSAMLMLAYYLLLKNKTIYTFNRWYLLLSIIFSLAVPFAEVKRAVAVLPSAIQEIQLTPAVIIQTESPAQVYIISPASAAIHQHINYGLYGSIAVYLIVTLLLLYRFVKNLNTIRRSVLCNPKVAFNGAQMVLIEDDITPHTFLNYIFINKKAYNNHQIETDILRHELTHACQRHSADVIFIELVQAILWFNPFIIFYREAIQLNHEFIADAAVVDGNPDIPGYQHLLLEKIGYGKSLGITSQFNYSVTKKRLIMMTKTTSATVAILTRLAIVPVLAIAFLLFCTRSQASQAPPADKPVAPAKQVKPSKADTTAGTKKRPPMLRFSDYPYTKDGVSEDKLTEYAQITAKYQEEHGGAIKPPGKVTDEDKVKLEAIFRQMSLEQQSRQTFLFYFLPPPPPPSSPTQKQLDKWKDPKFCGVWIDGKKVKNSDLDNYKPADFGNLFISRLTRQAINYPNYKYQVNLMTAAYYKKYQEDALANRHKPQMAVRMLSPRKAHI